MSNRTSKSSAEDIIESTTPRIKVLAGPGTGKSYAMKERVARLLRDGVPPHKILAVTFTRIAARDLQSDLKKVDAPRADQLRGQTLHGLAFRLLNTKRVGANFSRQPRVLADFERMPLLADLKEMGHFREDSKSKIRAYEAAWARLQEDKPGHSEDVRDQKFENDLVSWLTFHRAMIIGEVIPMLYRHVAGNPGLVDPNMYEHVLVDEYQDLNKAEQSLIAELAGRAATCIVGDEDQSIYGFKFAHPAGVREWPVGTAPMEAYDLSLCRRCPTDIVGMARMLISRNSREDRVPLEPMAQNGRGEVRIWQFSSLGKEAAHVAQDISRRVSDGTCGDDIIVLVPNKVVGSAVFKHLSRIGVRSRSYLQDATIESSATQRKLELLALSVDRDDRVALRWLLGDGLKGNSWRAPNYAVLRGHCRANACSPWGALVEAADGSSGTGIPHGLVAPFRAIREEVAEIEEVDNLCAVVDLLFSEGEDDSADVREIALRVMENHEGEDASRADLISEIRREIAIPEETQSDGCVRVMSLHKSKGLSAPVTYICGCVDELLPGEEEADQIAERRRLFYVGVTRVKAKPDEGMPGTLVLTYSSTFGKNDARAARIQNDGDRGYVVCTRSRFLDELGPLAPQTRVFR